MKEILVDLGFDSYYIVIDNDILKNIADLISKFVPGFEKKNSNPKKILIISDKNVSGIYGNLISENLKDDGFLVKSVSIVPGEDQKTLSTVTKLYEEFFDYEMDRKSLVVALGGGVVGDIAGFTASTFMRGVPCVQIPTTLLAQVDSSVGGKTGVNHPRGKNMIGAFYQPKAVFIDTNTLTTLPRAELIAGIVEVMKYGVIRLKPFFEYVVDNLQNILQLNKDALQHIVYNSCKTKAEVVQEDEKEKGVRAILNYGHTIGHAIEALTDYKQYRHGEAVAIGMVYATKIANEMGLVDKAAINVQVDLFKRLGLATEVTDLDPAEIVKKLYQDKKTFAGKLRFVLPEAIGDVIISDKVTDEIILKVLKN